MAKTKEAAGSLPTELHAKLEQLQQDVEKAQSSVAAAEGRVADEEGVVEARRAEEAHAKQKKEETQRSIGKAAKELKELTKRWPCGVCDGSAVAVYKCIKAVVQ